MSLLEVDDLHVHYGKVHALKGVSLRVEEGEIVTLIGGNGAGKTTTLRTLSGLRAVTSGSIRFGGESIVGAAPHKLPARGLCQAPEGRGIFPGMSVLENLEMGAFARPDRSRRALEPDLRRVYDLFPRLHERRDQPGGTLSGGEQQMLAIGRALMSRPVLLLLDEPSMGLAPLLVTQIFEIIAEINTQGTTILLVEQNAAQALQRAQRAYVLETGSIAMEGAAAELFDDPRVRASYLGGDVTG